MPFPKLAEYLQQSRVVAERWTSGAGRPPKRLGVLSSFSAEFLRPFLIVESDALVPLSPWFAPFGQFEPILFEPTSSLRIAPPDLTWLAMRLEDVDRELIHEHPELGDETKLRLGAIVRRLIALAEEAAKLSPVLVSNLALPYSFAAHPFDANDPDGLVFSVMDANRELARALSSISNAYVFDYAGLVADAGAETWRDARLSHAAKVPCGQVQQAMMARRFARSAAALLRPAAKCIVVDLDNTLWGGVLGDDGVEGLELGDDYPGSAFKEFQSLLLGYRRRGFLLAVSSKNEEAAVRDMLDTHPEQLIRTEHLAHLAANWEPKPLNLRRIAEALSIGLDSLVFVDDNPAERAHVRAELPMVTVVDLPQDPLEYVQALRELPVLDRPLVLAEDRARAEMYRQDAKRHAFEGSNGDYLSGLKMKAAVGLADAKAINRIHQLIHKTNQFNLTTRRHEMTVLSAMMQEETSRVAWLRLDDAFGDMGLVAVGILRRLEERTWEIDSFLMSCRVMGRKVEAAFLSYLAELASSAGATQLVARYRATAKNGVVKDFYPLHGFEETDRSLEELVFSIPIERAPQWPEHIQREAR